MSEPTSNPLPSSVIESRQYSASRQNEHKEKMSSDEGVKVEAPAATNTAHVERQSDSEKGEKQPQSYIPQSDADYDVTFKTWIVVGILSASYGLSFWIIPALAACQAVVATQLGDVTGQSWYLALYLMTITIAFMVCGGTLQSPFSVGIPPCSRISARPVGLLISAERPANSM